MSEENIKIVHGLLHGLPLCGFTSNVPALWPKNHCWTIYSNVGGMNCPDCVKNAMRMQEQLDEVHTKQNRPA